MENLGKEPQIVALEKLAEEVLMLKSVLGQRRPILIEFCGTPKSGKTTTITSLNIFLKRNGFQTEIITEMASVCPVENKTHPFFNSWTLFSSLAATIKALSLRREEVDIIIVDRAIFDALCWFEWLNTNVSKANPYLDDKAFKSYKALLLHNELWTSLFDLTLVFKASPEVALKREYANLLTSKHGSIMNTKVIKSFNKAIDESVKKYKRYFNKVEEFDTTNDDDPNNVGLIVTKKTLNLLIDILQEKIGFVSRNIVRQLKYGINDCAILSKYKLAFLSRDNVEESDNIQPIAIAVITNRERDKVFVVRKNPRRLDKKNPKRSPEFNRYLLYIGGHIRQEDQSEDHSNCLDTIKRTLHREIDEEIGESIFPKEITPFLIYTPDNAKSKRHLAVTFVIEMDFENKNFKLRSDEFKKRSKRSLNGKIVSVDDLVNIDGTLESWSIQILKYVFNRDFKRKQLDLFDDNFKQIDPTILTLFF
jgi:predicted NUDIX family phosphoesterase